MVCAAPRSTFSGGNSTASRNSAKPTGAKAHAFHKLSGRTTSAAPAKPSITRKAVQARGVERRVKSFGKLRERKKSDSATDSRKRSNPDRASVGGNSPGRSGGMESVFMACGVKNVSSSFHEIRNRVRSFLGQGL